MFATGLGLNCKIRFRRCDGRGEWRRDLRDEIAQGRFVFGAAKFFQKQFSTHIVGQGGSHVLITGEAEDGGVEVRGQELDAKLTFGLEAAQLGQGAVEDAMGVSAGAVDGLLGFVEKRIWRVAILFRPDRHHGGFDGGTAAQTPGGVDDLGGQSVLDCAFGPEVGLEAGAELGVEVVLAVEDEVAAGVEPVGERIAGNSRFSGGRNRSAGGLGVIAIGGDLSVS